MLQIQLYYLISQSHLIQSSHLFKSVTNSAVLSDSTFSSLSTVAHIQYCHKFSCISSLHSYLFHQSKHIQKFHKFTCLIQFHILISFKVPHIKQCYKFNNLISFYILILFNSSMYSNVQQSQWSYLGLHSHLLQQSHLFNSVTNSVVLSNFTFISHSTVQNIQQCHIISCIIWFHSIVSFNSYIYSHCHKFNNMISFYILILFNSSIYSKVSQIH